MILGTWFLVGGFSKMRFCPDGTWHERAGSFYLHGSYTLVEDVLTLVTLEKRWRDQKVRYEEYVAIETQIASLDENSLRFKGAVRHSSAGITRDEKEVLYRR